LQFEPSRTRFGCALLGSFLVLLQFWTFAPLTPEDAIAIAATRPIIRTPIAIHEESSYVASDISKIIHVPTESRIEVHLKSNSTRRCQNPVFKGRISGWSLSMIEFDSKFNSRSHESDVIVGTYNLSQMPLSGKYYVEIIVLLCEGFGKGFRGVNLRNVCLEDMEDDNHRITAGNGTASIDIVVDQTVSTCQQNHSLSYGQWLHRDYLASEARTINRRENSTKPSSAVSIPPPEPIFTSYQPEKCYYRNIGKGKKVDFCEDLRDYERFKDYTFRWNRGPYAMLNEPFLSNPHCGNREHHTHVCFVGASHSRILDQHCQKLLEPTREEANHLRERGLQVPDLNCSYAHIDMTDGSFTEDLALTRIGRPGCTVAVVGTFQWPFSFKQHKPNWTLAEWKSDVTNMVGILTNLSKEGKIPLRKVLLRSAHANGLKWDVSMCPPRDMRGPVNADGATTILREVAESFVGVRNEQSPIVSFLDTSFLLDPVWDSPEDWSHYMGKEGEMETKFILSEILIKEDYTEHWDWTINNH